MKKKIRRDPPLRPQSEMDRPTRIQGWLLFRRDTDGHLFAGNLMAEKPDPDDIAKGLFGPVETVVGSVFVDGRTLPEKDTPEVTL